MSKELRIGTLLRLPDMNAEMLAFLKSAGLETTQIGRAGDGWMNGAAGVEQSEKSFRLLAEHGLDCVSLFMMMPPGTYIKEWTYEHALLADESLVRNYAERDYPFLGRPQEMIQHSEGDIVVAVEADHAFWGVVGGLPPIYDGHEHGDWSDDQYLVWSAPGHHHHIRAHHVLCPWSPVPSFITPLLEGVG
jgi:hypothetical protein